MKKWNHLIFALAFQAGVFLCCGNAYFSSVPKNVVVNGVEVGRLTYGEAVVKVRSHIASTTPSLVVVTPQGEREFSYPEIDFYDDVESVVRKAKRNNSYECRVDYYLKAEDTVLHNLCLFCDREAKNAYAEFDGTFAYYGEESGLICDEKQLKRDVERSLRGDFSPVVMQYGEVKPKKTLNDVRGETALLSSFTTYFDGSNANRSHNIALAAKSINGTVLESGEEFSFNRVVGKRSAERGYLPAKIISGGVFVYGTGGGVCQASSTVYNAALLCGMKITRAKAHSLSVSYVEPSFDAMVSSVSDMSFVNPHGTPVYIACKTGNNFITVCFYGKSDGLTYERASEIVSYTEPEESIVEEGEEDLVKVAPKRGIKSTGSILVYKDGVLKEKRQIRTDEYKSVQGVLVKKRSEEAQPIA